MTEVPEGSAKSWLAVIRPRGALSENENVGGSGHDCDMSKPQPTSADTHPALGPWFLTKVPSVDVDSPARLR